MRISRAQRAITAAVMTTVATATVVTFARADDAAPTTAVAGLPNSSGDYQPSVSGTPAPIALPPTTATPDAQIAAAAVAQVVPTVKPTKAAKPAKTQAAPQVPDSRPTTGVNKPVPTPAPSPSPTQTPKNLLQLLNMAP